MPRGAAAELDHGPACTLPAAAAAAASSAAKRTMKRIRARGMPGSGGVGVADGGSRLWCIIRLLSGPGCKMQSPDRETRGAAETGAGAWRPATGGRRLVAGGRLDDTLSVEGCVRWRS